MVTEYKNMTFFEKEFKNSFVSGDTIRLKWALGSRYGDKNYTVFCNSEKQALEMANSLDIAFPNGENFAALRTLAGQMKSGFELIKAKPNNNFPNGFYFVKIKGMYAFIEYGNLVYYREKDIKHNL